MYLGVYFFKIDVFKKFDFGRKRVFTFFSVYKKTGLPRGRIVSFW